jgi:hypothetical protein
MTYHCGMPKKKREQNSFELVVIQWVDAFDGPNGWFDPKEYKPVAAKPVTTGWLIPDFMDGYITVVSTYLYEDEDLTCSTPVHIPNKWIESITVIPVPANIKK